MDGIVLDCSLNEMEEKGMIEISEEEKEKQEEEYALRERKIADVYIPPEELEELRKSYSHSIVQDFDDMYHMSDEEKEKMGELYNKFITLKKYKKKTRKIDEYVKIHRLCLDILNDVAETNGIYPPEKFKKLVLSGKILVDGLNFPKLQGKARKTINWNYVSREYIEDTSKDPKELIREDKSEDFVTEESFDKAIERYFGSKEELDEMIGDVNKEDESASIDEFMNPEKYDYIATVGDKKSRKNLVKFSPVILDEIKKREKLDKRNRRCNSYITNLSEDDMEFIERYDLKRNKKKNNGVPVFRGDITNEADVEFYEQQMDEYERANTYVDYNGKSVTIDEYNELELKTAMDANGWNIRKLYVNKKEEKKLKKLEKADKKKEKRIKKMLIEIQNRREGRKDKESVQAINSKKKKKGLSKKKKKKVKKNHKKEIDYFDDVLLDINGSTKETFNKYREEMEDFTWKK